MVDIKTEGEQKPQLLASEQKGDRPMSFSRCYSLGFTAPRLWQERFVAGLQYTDSTPGTGKRSAKKLRRLFQTARGDSHCQQNRRCGGDFG